MRKIFLLFLLAPFHLSTQAQDLAHHIPAYAQVVMTLNAQNYAGKADMAQVSKMDFFKNLQKDGRAPYDASGLCARILIDPAEAGVELLPQAYVFRIDRDSVSGWCFLFGLKDPARFAGFIKKALQEKEKTEPLIEQATGCSFISGSRISASWTPGFALLFMADNSYPYTPEVFADNAVTANQSDAQTLEDSLMKVEMIKAEVIAKETEKTNAKSLKKNNSKARQKVIIVKEAELKAQADSIAVALMAQMASDSTSRINNDWEQQEKDRLAKEKMEDAQRNSRFLNRLLNLKPENSITGTRSFSDAQKEKFDVAVWMNYAGQSIPGMGSMGYRHSYRRDGADTASALPVFARNNYSVAWCNFEKGKIQVTHTVYLNPEMARLTAGMYKTKGCKKFSKYIQGENLMGYASVSMDVEKTLKGMRSMMTQIYESSFGKEAKYVTGMMDITAVFTNDDVVNNLFKGDFVFAITDLKPFKVSYRNYAYDENFNRSETSQEKVEVLPEFTAMATVGKPEELSKILNAIVKMGGLKQESKDLYLVEYPGQNSIKLYLALENNILFLTNNADLIHSKLKSGYSRKEQMNAEQKKMLESGALAFYWNGSKTFDLMSKQPDFKPGEKMQRTINLFKDNFRAAEASGVQQNGNSYTTHASLSLTDPDTNSLYKLFALVNSFYLNNK